MKSDVILWDVLQYLDMLCIIWIALISLGIQSIIETFEAEVEDNISQNLSRINSYLFIN